MQSGNSLPETVTLPDWQAFFPLRTVSTATLNQNIRNNLLNPPHVKESSQQISLASSEKSSGYGNLQGSQQTVPTSATPSLQNTWSLNNLNGYQLIANPSNVQITTISPPLMTLRPPLTLPHEICRAHIVDAYRLWSETDYYDRNAENEKFSQ